MNGSTFRWHNREGALETAKKMVLSGQDPVFALRAIINGQVFCRGKNISKRGWVNFLSQLRKDAGIIGPFSPGPRSRKESIVLETPSGLKKDDFVKESIELLLRGY